MKKLILLFSFFPAAIFAQSSKQESIWLPMKLFIGEWTGKGGGEPGIGDYERSYQWLFNGKYIEIHNKSTYPPSANYPEGEVHEDAGFISYDKARKTFVLRQFHVEGFVNQYKLDSISSDGKTLVFITESIENIPAGWKAKETYQPVSNLPFALAVPFSTSMITSASCAKSCLPRKLPSLVMRKPLVRISNLSELLFTTLFHV